MRNETRVGVVVGLLIVVITSVYFYGSSRQEEDVLVGLGRRGAVAPAAKNPAPQTPAPKAAATPRPATVPKVAAAPPKSVLPPPQPVFAPPPAVSTAAGKPRPVPSPMPVAPPDDRTALVDASKPRRLDVPPPSPTPLRTAASPALTDATRRNLETDAVGGVTEKQPPAGLDLGTIGDRIRRSALDVVNPAPSTPVPPAGGSPNAVRGAAVEPARSTEKAVPSPLPPAARASATDGWPKLHRIESGETLYGIAMKYYGRSSGAKLILRANPGVKGAKYLKLGQVLTIPSPDSVDSTPDPAQFALGNARSTVSSSSTSPGTTSYVVQEGDSFYTIAKRMLGSSNRWEEIFEMNKAAVGGSAKHLKPGMTIIIPKAK